MRKNHASEVTTNITDAVHRRNCDGNRGGAMRADFCIFDDFNSLAHGHRVANARKFTWGVAGQGVRLGDNDLQSHQRFVERGCSIWAHPMALLWSSTHRFAGRGSA